MMFALRMLSLLLPFLLVSSALAQTVLYEWEGTPSSQQIGGGLRFVGDRDGDGVPDFTYSGGNFTTPTTGTYSGARGALIPASAGLNLRALGDVDNDGTDDYAVVDPFDGTGGPNAGAVGVFSGATNGLLHQFFGAPGQYLGIVTVDAGDVNADGYDDILMTLPTGLPYWVSAPANVHVRSGIDGSLLHNVAGNVNIGFGSGAAGVGDVDGDGYDDFAIGSNRDWVTGIDAGSVKVHSGFDGSLIHSWYGIANNDFLDTVIRAGDVNLDGFDDILIAARQTAGNSGYVRLCSGLSGLTLRWSIGFASGDDFGSSITMCGDLNNDGYPDYAVGAEQNGNWAVQGGPGYFEVISGFDGAILLHVDGDAPGHSLGSTVAGGEDLNGDGHPDLLVRDRLYSVPGQWVGLVRVYSLVDLPLRTDGHLIPAAAGGTQTFTIDAGAGQGGNTYIIAGTTAGTTPGLAIGATGLIVPLNPSPYFFSSILSANLPPLQNNLGVLSASGTATASFTWPPLPLLPGSTIIAHHALAVIDGGGAISLVSPAVPLTITP